MTGCRDTDRLVTAYVDGELDERRSSALRGHLRVCERCAERVEDEVRMRDAAARLEPLDPPTGLWKAIDTRLAQEEIDDSRRSPLWLWWQRALDGARRHAVPLGVVGAAAAALLAVWLTRAGAEERTARTAGGAPAGGAAQPGGPADPAEPAEPAAADPTRSADRADRGGRTDDECGAAASHDEQVRCQIARSDRRYLEAIDELSGALAAERQRWTAEEAARVDAALAELDRAADEERKRLAVADGVTPADLDPLHAIYRAKIDLLSQAVIAGAPAVAALPGGMR